MSSRSSRKRSRSESAEPQVEVKRFRQLPPDNRIVESKLNEGKTSQILDFFTFGSNEVGQLGVSADSKGASAELVALDELTEINSVSFCCGKDSTVVLEVNTLPDHRNVYTWGGDRSVNARDFDEEADRPIPVEVLNKQPLIQVAAGHGHALALTSTGEVISWGTYHDNKGQAIGFRPRMPEDEYGLPEVMEEIEDVKIIQVAATTNRSIALTETGDIYEWGFTKSENRTLARHSKETLIPSSVIVPAKIVAVYAEGNGGSIFAEDTDGLIWAWGDNQFYQCGVDDEVTVSTEAKDQEQAKERAEAKRKSIRTHSRPAKAKQINQVLEDESAKVKKVTSGRHHSVLLTQDGHVFTWGSNVKGQLGIDGVGSDEVVPVPTRLTLGSNDGNIVDISAGPFHTLLLTRDGKVLGFGANKDHCLGTSKKDIVSTPTEIPLKNKKKDVKVSGISCGSRHNLIAVERT